MSASLLQARNKWGIASTKQGLKGMQSGHWVWKPWQAKSGYLVEFYVDRNTGNTSYYYFDRD
jgi:hypothetical protein